MELELKYGQVIGCCSVLAAAAEVTQPGIWDKTEPQRMEALRTRLEQLVPGEVGQPGPSEVEEEEEQGDTVESLSEEELELEVERPVWDLCVVSQSGRHSRVRLMELPMEDGDERPQYKLLQGDELEEHLSKRPHTTGCPVKLQATGQAPPRRPPLPIPLPAPAAHLGNPYLTASESCVISTGMGQAVKLTPGPSRATGCPLLSHGHQCQESNPGWERRGLAQPASQPLQTRKRKLGK